MDSSRNRHFFAILFLICTTLSWVAGQNDDGYPPVLNKWNSVFEEKSDGATTQFESCVKVCTKKNPEAKELCNLNCKKDSQGAAQPRKNEKVEPKPETSYLEGMFSYMYKQSSSFYNWMNSFFSTPDTSSKQDLKEGEIEKEKVQDDEENREVKEEKEIEKEEQMKKSNEVKVEQELKESKEMKKEKDLNEDKGLNIRIWRLGGEKEEKNGEVAEGGQTVVHRLIIIKHIPFFSLLNNPKQNTPHVGDVGVKKYVSWFGEERCAWKRSLLFFFFSLLFVTSTWYCITKLLSYRNQALQDSKLRTDDLEYLIPTDEKVIFMNHHSKLAMLDEVTPPPPYKPHQSINA